MTQVKQFLEEHRRAATLATVLVIQMMIVVDVSIVNVALPVIQRDLGVGQAELAWILDGYLIAFGSFLLVAGRLGDLLGRRRVLLGGLALFVVASALCGIAPNVELLVAARVLQGLGGAFASAVVLAIIATEYPSPQERARAMSLYVFISVGGGSLGLLAGGLLTQAISWHWIFFVNVPIGLIALVILWRLLPPIRRPDAAKNIDFLGAAVFTGAIAPFLIGLTNKQTPGAQWTDPAVGGLMLLGVVIGVVFLRIESRVPEPIVRLDLFRIPAFTISVAAMFLAAFGFFGAIIFLPRWFQVVAGASATESGYNLLPILGALIISATLSGQIVARTHHYKALIFVAMLLLAGGLFLLTNLRADTDRPILWIWMIITGLGIGPSFAVFTLIVQNSVAPKVIGVATASLTFFQQIGGTIGLTIASTVFADKLTADLPPRLVAAGVPPAFLSQFQPGGQLDLTGTGDLGQRILAATPDAFKPQVQPLIAGIVGAVHTSFSLAVAAGFWVSIAAAIVGAVFVLFLREQPMRETFEMDPTDAELASGATPPARSATEPGGATGG